MMMIMMIMMIMMMIFGHNPNIRKSQSFSTTRRPSVGSQPAASCPGNSLVTR